MKTYSAKPTDVSRVWHILDASLTPLGRLSTIAARLLLGKDKPTITSHIDVGDYVIIINADSLITTGNKLRGKTYYRHSGFPGGLYKRTLEESIKKDSVEVIRHSVRGMLPVNKLRKARLDRLKIYAGNEHHHNAQNPQKFEPKKGRAKDNEQ
ncbi:50S ribosomal protein L13 [Candidatus Saccharibacteria bacterium]|nr:50S ribosomal protein L13 [Candidatus Saccharibacteria bacterium]